MDFNTVLNNSGIPVLLAVICFYYSWKLIKMHDLASIRGKDAPKVKKPEEYAEKAGRLILIFGLAVVVNAVLVNFNTLIAMIEILAAVVWMFISWKRMYDHYE